MAKVSAKEKIQAWLENPTTPYDAWVYLTYDEIAQQSGVSRSSVDRYLVILIARTRGYDLQEVKTPQENGMV